MFYDGLYWLIYVSLVKTCLVRNHATFFCLYWSIDCRYWRGYFCCLITCYSVCCIHLCIFLTFTMLSNFGNYLLMWLGLYSFPRFCFFLLWSCFVFMSFMSFVLLSLFLDIVVFIVFMIFTFCWLMYPNVWHLYSLYLFVLLTNDVNKKQCNATVLQMRHWAIYKNRFI